MANYTIKDFENQQGKIFIEQNIQDKTEVMSYQEDSLPPLGELWLMKYGNANEEFYSLRIDTPVSDLNHGFLKVKKLNDDFFKKKRLKQGKIIYLTQLKWIKKISTFKKNL